MPVITAGAFPISMIGATFDGLGESEVQSRSSTQVVFWNEYEEERYIFTGSFGSFDGDGVPHSGTITGFVLVSEGQTAVTITGMSFPVASMVGYVQTGSFNAFVQALLAGDDDITGSNATGADLLLGGAGSDVIRGLNGSDELRGEAGDDTLDGGDGDDSLWGGANEDILRGGAGTDLLYGEAGNDRLTGGGGNDNLYGGDGSDVFVASGGGIAADTGNDRYDGGGGIDEVDFRGAQDALVIDLRSGTATDSFGGSDTLVSIERVRGGAFNDVFYGAGVLSQLYGEGGNDYFYAGAQGDAIDGGSGLDYVSYALASSGVDVDLQVWGVQNTLGSGHDSLFSIEALHGSDHADSLVGSSGWNQLAGGGGGDTLVGMGGPDYLLGEDGDDFLIGVTPDGSASGVDRLTGGAGSDFYLVDAGDAITEFSAEDDAVVFHTAHPVGRTMVVANEDGSREIRAYDASYSTYTSTRIDSVAAEVRFDAEIYNGEHGSGVMLARTGPATTVFDEIAYDGATGAELVEQTFDDALSDIIDVYANLIDPGAGGLFAPAGDSDDPQAIIEPITLGIAIGLVAVVINHKFQKWNHDTSGLSQEMGGQTRVQGFFNAARNILSEGPLGVAYDWAVEHPGRGWWNPWAEGARGDDEGSNDGALFQVTPQGDTQVGLDILQLLATRDAAEFRRLMVEAAQEDAAAMQAIQEGREQVRENREEAERLYWGSGSSSVEGGGGDDDMVQWATFGPRGAPAAQAEGPLRASDGNQTLDGGAGVDTVHYLADTRGVTVNLSAGTATGADIGSDTLISIESVRGGSGNDTLTGSAGANELWGMTGNDTLAGGAGADLLHGGAGIDTASYVNSAGGVVVDLDDNSRNTGGDAHGDTFASIENLTGSAFDDQLYGDDGENVLVGGLGNDLLDGRGGVDTVSYAGETGGWNIDLFTGAASNGAHQDVLRGIESVIGSSGSDVIQGGFADDRLDGGAGNDHLRALGGSDSLYGGAGADAFEAVEGVTRMFGGSGFDQFRTSGNQTLVIDGGADGGRVSFWFNSYEWTLKGYSGAGIQLKQDGSIVVIHGQDRYHIANIGALEYGDNGFAVSTNTDFRVNGTGGSDELGGSVFDNTFYGFAGNDFFYGGGGSDFYDGGDGVDTARLDMFREGTGRQDETTGPGVTASLSISGWQELGAGQRVQFVSIENLTATNLSDRLTGSAGSNTLTGYQGDDVLDGAEGADHLIGGAGNDVLIVDHFADLVTELANQGTDEVRASISYTLGAELENLTLLSDAALDGTGNAKANVITGNDAANALFGLAGDDTLHGQGGDDVLTGGAGADKLNGSSGIDIAAYSGLRSAYTVTVRSNGTIAVSGAEGPDELESIEALRFSNGTFDIVGGMLSADARRSLQGGLGADTLIGAGSRDTLNGGEGDDVLSGLAADDRLSGGLGDDVLIGGTGNDLLDGGAGSDLAEFSGLRSASTIAYSGGSIFVTGPDGSDELRNIEALRFANGTFDVVNGVVSADARRMLWGGAGADTLNGGGSNDILRGGLGNDTLNGGSGDDTLYGQGGDDTMVGGTGDDTYVLIEAGDQIVEQAGEGIDTVQAWRKYRLGDHEENLVLMVSVAGEGNELDNAITGNHQWNWLYGYGGSDVIDGGLGDDNIYGGEGSDVLLGGEGNDWLDSGTGSDAMTGGIGNDTYVVDTLADQITELAGEGTDTVRSWINWTLQAEVENLTLLGGAVSGTGNAAGNALTGNAGTNYLAGLDGNDTLDGGAGDDFLYGGLGDDTYVVTEAGDQTIEQAGQGTDTVQAWRGWTLGANVENLTLMAGVGGTGNGLNNVITGNASNNFLYGLGGDDTLVGGGGNDTLAGGSGADTHVFTGAFGQDTVTDFYAAAGLSDMIRFSTDVFADFAAVMAAASDTAGGVVITASGGRSVTLTGVSKAQLSADDFLFVAPSAPLEAKDTGPLVLPADQDTKPDLFSGDDAIICPAAESDTVAKDLQPLVLPDEAAELEPLVLPHEAEAGDTTATPATPETSASPSGFLSRWMQSAEAHDILSAALDSFDGRDPHTFRWNLTPADDTVDDGLDPLDPLVLPAEVGPKDNQDAPVVCHPIDTAPSGPFAFVMDSEARLSGRDPHRLLIEPARHDWVV